jgi:hypothetical protein
VRKVGDEPARLLQSISQLRLSERHHLRLLCLGVILSAALGCSSRGSSAHDRLPLVSRLPACFMLQFGGDQRPELDVGVLPDTITLTRPFTERETGGYIYAGALPDSLIPRSRAMAQRIRVRVIGWWQTTPDSLLLSADGTVRAVGVYFGPTLEGVWHQRNHRGETRQGTLRASRVSCREEPS